MKCNINRILYYCFCDTFTGHFPTGFIENMAIPDILKMSSKASSIAVTRHGAVQSIPFRKEVDEALK